MATPANYQSFFSALATDYSSFARYPPALIEQCVNLLSLRLERPPGRFLDIGTGAGYPAQRLATRLGNLQPVLIDTSPPMLANARRLWPASLRQPFTIAAGARDLPFTAATFDLAWSSFMIHLLDDRQACFAEALRVLNSDGVYAIVCHAPEDVQSLVLHRFFPGFNDADQARMPPIPLVVAELRNVGFSAVSQERINYTIVYPSRRHLVEFMSTRPFSALAMLSEAEFSERLSKFRSAVERALPEGEITSSSVVTCLFALRREGNA